MSTEIASLSLEIDSSSAVAAKKDQDALTESGKKLETQYSSITQAQINATYASQKAAEAWQNQRASVEGASDSVQKILNRYDPLGTKLRQLQTDFSTLDKAIAQGATGGTSDSALDKTMAGLNTEIAKTKELMVTAGVVTDGTAFSMTRLGLNTQYARRELTTLGREAISGDFSRMPLTLGSLVAHSNLLPILLNPVALAIAGIAAAAGVMAVAFTKGQAEAHGMNNALELTSGYAGVTRGDMRLLAQQVSDTTSLTIGSSKTLVTQLVNSGQISSTALGTVSRLASDYAAATGKEIDKVTPELIKMFSDPAKGAEELNKQMHFLSPQEVEHIAHLERIGQFGAAQLELAQKLSAHLPNQATQLGFIEKAWDGIKKSASSAWDAMLGVGRPQTPEEKLLATLRAAGSPMASAPGFNQNGSRSAPTASSTAYAAGQEAYEAASLAASTAGIAEANAATNKAGALVRQVSEYAKIKGLQDDITNIQKNAPDGVDKARAIFDLNKQIRDIRLSIGAEGAAMANARIDAELRLREITLGMAQDQNDTQLKLRQILQSEHDATKQSLELQKNTVQQIAVQEYINVGNMTAGQRQILDLTLQRLKAEAEALGFKGSNQQAIDALAARDAEAKGIASIIHSVNQLGDAENTHLTNTIAAQRLHNAEIGKTREQVELEKQKVEEAGTRELEIRYAAIDALLKENGLNQNAIDIYTAMQVQLEEQIKSRKELAALMGEASVLEKQAEETKKLTEFWKQAARSMQQSMSGLFFDVMQGNLKNLGASFKSSIDRMVSDILAAKAATALFGADFGKGGDIGGLVGAGLKMFGAGTGAGVAVLGGGGGATAGLAQAFLPASFDVGTEFVSHDQLAYIHRGEKITPAAQNTSSNDAGRTSVVVHNSFTVNGQTDRRSQAQIAAAAGEGVQRALSRNS